MKAGDDPERWVERAAAYRALGATHLRVMTAGGGFTTPQEHLDAALRWRAALGSRPRPVLTRLSAVSEPIVRASAV